MATYGEGEPTDNALSFNTWIKNEAGGIDGTYLKDLSFTVFGLGNTQYEHFNAMGKRTNECIGKLGAKRVFEYGEGDDDGTLEDDFQKWKMRMWESLVKQFHPASPTEIEKTVSPEIKKVALEYNVIPITSKTPKSSIPALISGSSSKISPTNKHFFTAPLVRSNNTP